MFQIFSLAWNCLMGILLYYTVNLYTTSQNRVRNLVCPTWQCSLVAHHVMCRSCWCFDVVRCYHSFNWTWVDILPLLSGCMHPMLSTTGSIVCQSHVSFTSICVCMCSCLFFMRSLTHDFEYIDNFVTLFYVGRSHHLQNNFKNKQFKQGFTGTTCYWVCCLSRRQDIKRI